MREKVILTIGLDNFMEKESFNWDMRNKGHCQVHGKGGEGGPDKKSSLVIGTEVATWRSDLRICAEKGMTKLLFIKNLFSRTIIVMKYRNICGPCVTNSKHLLVVN